MQAFSSFSISLNFPKYNVPGLHSKPLSRKLPWHQSAVERRRKNSAGVVQYLPAICPDILVREARPEDYWEVAETHCSSFFPDRGFPMDLVLRADRLVAMFAGFSIPPGCRKQCLVAIDERLTDENTFLNSMRHENVELESKLPMNGGRISGILTIDTVAEFLPRRGHLGNRRAGIAYISNVAVQQRKRRRGIAQRLVIEAEALARSWGCRSMALHCDVNNPAALALYQRQGFRCIKVPAGAKWPQPKAVPVHTYFTLMITEGGKQLLQKYANQKSNLHGDSEFCMGAYYYQVWSPSKLIIDNVTCFRSEEHADFYFGHGINLSYSSPYHPWWIGQTECNQ